MKTLYFDCFAGASGNMILGALIAAGVDVDELRAELKKLNVADFDLKVETVDRSGISAVHVLVAVPDEKAHRHLHQIEEIIEASGLSDRIKERSILIFRRLAEAEAKVHGIGIEKVHFHEVGALDAIVDIVGACIGFEMLAIEQFACSKIHVGSGFVEMDHGTYPVPPPAVAELLRNAPVYSGQIEGELITPTGAAIITTVSGSYGIVPELTLEVAAYGAGTRDPKKFPNVLRILIGETDETGLKPVSRETTLSLLETNIDDLPPQILGFVMERAFELGALDCWFTPIQMKKNRPASMVSILCEIAEEPTMLDLLYRETTTIGVRIQKVERHCLDRTISTVATEYGEIGVKVASREGKTLNEQPEFDDVRAAALRHNVPLRRVVDVVKSKLGGNE